MGHLQVRNILCEGQLAGPGVARLWHSFEWGAETGRAMQGTRQRPKLCYFRLHSNFCYVSRSGWTMEAVHVLQEDPDLYWNVRLESGLLVGASAEHPALQNELKIRSFIAQDFLLTSSTTDCPHSSVPV